MQYNINQIDDMVGVNCYIAYHPLQLDTRHYTLMKAIAATGKETKISSPTTEKVAEK